MRSDCCSIIGEITMDLIMEARLAMEGVPIDMQSLMLLQLASQLEIPLPNLVAEMEFPSPPSGNPVAVKADAKGLGKFFLLVVTLGRAWRSWTSKRK